MKINASEVKVLGRVEVTLAMLAWEWLKTFNVLNSIHVRWYVNRVFVAQVYI